MKKTLVSILVAAAMAFSASGFASDLVDNGYLIANPVYSESMVLTVDPLLVPASRQNSDSNIAVSDFRRMYAVNYYQLNIDNLVLPVACGYESKMIPVPTKIPISKAV